MPENNTSSHYKIVFVNNNNNNNKSDRKTCSVGCLLKNEFSVIIY